MSDECLCVTCPVLAPNRKPRYVERGMVCEPDRITLAHLLGEIPDLYARLDAVPGSSATERVAGSRDPAIPPRVDVVDLTLPARPGSIGIAQRGLWEGSGGDPDQVGYLSIATELDFWVQDWRISLYRDHSLPGTSVIELAGWLRVRLPQACDSHPAIDEFAAAINSLTRTLRATVDPRPPGQSAGRCPAKLRDDTRCNSRLQVDAYLTAEPIRCPRCGSSWERRDGGWMALRAQQDEWIKTEEEAA
jgi:hypothetical protein